MKVLIIHAAIYLTFYILAAYATTDILRLLKGCHTPVYASACYCPACHQKIALKDQLPIISYLKNQGSCKTCKSPIPITDFFLELFLFIALSVLSCLLHFSWTAFVFCILCYESTKLLFLLIFGTRKSGFLKNLMISLFINLLLFSILAFLFALEHLI